MLTETHFVALGLAALAAAAPSADPPPPSIAIRPDRPQAPAADRACPATTALAPDVREPQVRLVRFYRAGSGMTHIWAFLVVPPADVSPDPGYEIAVRVKDSTERTLHAESWPGTPRASAAGARPLEMLHFLAAPGAYRLEVDVVERDTDRRRQGVFDFRTYEDDPGASDLLLAALIRIDRSLDAAIGPGEFRHGASIVTPAAVPCVPAERGRVYYLLEVYLEGMLAQTGTMEASVTNAAGRALAHTTTVPITVGTGGAMLRGQVPVEGLAPGAYALRVQAKVGARTLVRAAPFVVDSFRPAAREPAVVLQGSTYQNR